MKATGKIYKHVVIYTGGKWVKLCDGKSVDSVHDTKPEKILCFICRNRANIKEQED